ncbi:hypothetical protein [Cellulophaga sp. Asnod2-G02]|uniref:hypothetical protein n=1 Tax=Cellulophaga sp. Asnod2-G02 TaxID=3160572 RepID=UPI003866093D
MKSRLISWLLFTLAITGIIFSSTLLLKGNRACSGDGCLIKLLLLPGVFVMIPSVLIALYILVQSLRKK